MLSRKVLNILGIILIIPFCFMLIDGVFRLGFFLDMKTSFRVGDFGPGIEFVPATSRIAVVFICGIVGIAILWIVRHKRLKDK